jgi:hypothetical protein
VGASPRRHRTVDQKVAAWTSIDRLIRKNLIAMSSRVPLTALHLV